MLSSVACLDVPYFFKLSHKRHDRRTEVSGRITCVVICSTTVTETSHSKRIHRDVNKRSASYKVPVILVGFLMKLEFSRQGILNFTNIRSMSRAMRTTNQREGRMGMTKLVVTFRNFANALKNCSPLQ
jgi:hypothetical protein